MVNFLNFPIFLAFLFYPLIFFWNFRVRRLTCQPEPRKKELIPNLNLYFSNWRAVAIRLIDAKPKGGQRKHGLWPSAVVSDPVGRGGEDGGPLLEQKI